MELNDKLDRSAFSVGNPDDEDDARLYWRARMPEERLAAMEFLRQVMYGYDPATARMERVLEFVELERR